MGCIYRVMGTLLRFPLRARRAFFLSRLSLGRGQRPVRFFLFLLFASDLARGRSEPVGAGFRGWSGRTGHGVLH